MKLTVLYEEDGRIASLARVPERDTDDPIAAMLRSGVEPSAGQRAAVVELDPSWHHSSLPDILHRTVREPGDDFVAARRQDV